MPNISIYLSDDMNKKLEKTIPEDMSRSEWVENAIKGEMQHEHDELEDLTRRVEELEEWRSEVMEEISQYFYA